MASFDFAKVHELQTYNPPPGLIIGTVEPDPGESGNFGIEFTDADQHRVIASAQVVSPDGGPAPVRAKHNESGQPPGGVFQRNVSYSINQDAASLPVPVCLRSS